MAKDLRSWLSEVAPTTGKSVKYLSEVNFFRDPIRPMYSDPNIFFSPADGVILYQQMVEPNEKVDVKGCNFSVSDLIREPMTEPCLVIGIFMTFFDVHVNRIPYPGILSYAEHEPLTTVNAPMLDVEQGLLDCLKVTPGQYVTHNQRMVNTIHVPSLDMCYYLVQIADYDVDTITPFCLSQLEPVEQCDRFSMIRFGSQVDLIIPHANELRYSFCQNVYDHVEAGTDPLVRIEF